MFSFDEFGSDEDNWRPEGSRFGKIAWKVFGALFAAFVFGLIGLMTFRLFASKPPAEMKDLVWNESLTAAQKEYGDGLEIKHILTYESFSDDAMFSISAITRCVQTGQLQMTVRYNDRVLNYLEADFPGAKEREGEKYSFVLRDNLGNEYRDYTFTSAEKTGYTYRRLVFENVPFDDVSEMKLYVSYSGDPEAAARHVLYVYRYDFDVIDFEWKK